jgi:hypothetical protein
MEYWESNAERVGTSLIVAGTPPKSVTAWKDGDIVQCFSTKYWAYHLGLKASHLPVGSKSSKFLNSNAIGIELCNWGLLTMKKDGSVMNAYGKTVPENQITEFSAPYRGSKYYHTYTDAQLESTRQLLIFLGQRWDIPVKFKGINMFEIDVRCQKGESGVWTHTSIRPDKSDCSPQPNLIQMLNSL